MEDPALHRVVPSGFYVLFSFLQGDKRLCREHAYFFGKDAHREALAFISDILENPEELGSLDEGKYLINIHPAFQGQGTEPNDYDEGEVIDRIEFLLSKQVTVKVIER